MPSPDLTRAVRRPSGLLLVLLLVLTGPGGCTYLHTRSPAARISYEEQVGRSFAMEASVYFRWLDEPEVLDFVKALSHRIAAQVNGSHYSYRFYVVRNPVMNAFAVPGGYICIFAGMIASVDSVDELAGVIAHEIGHVEENHFIRGQQKADLTSIATVAATILAAALGGGQEAAAVGTLAQAVQETSQLHYSREYEREADRYSVELVRRAGFDPRGITSAFRKFREMARLNSADLPPYFLTHPLPSERIYEVNSWVDSAQLPPAPRRSTIRGFELAKVTARLRTEKNEFLLADLKKAADENPDDAMAQFLLGYFHLKRGTMPLAEQYLAKAYWLDGSRAEHALYLARANHIDGRLVEARRLLDVAYDLDPQNALVEVYLGDLTEQTGDKEESLEHYRRAVILNPRSCIAHMSLGMAYGRRGEIGKSYLELGLGDKCSGRYVRCLHYMRMAQKNLPPDSKEKERVGEEIASIEG